MKLYEEFKEYTEMWDSLTEAKADTQKLIDFAGDELANRFLAIKNRLKAPENDLYYWIKNKTVAELEQAIVTAENTKSNRQMSRDTKINGAKLIDETEFWRVYHITSFEASQRLGRDTQWCITGVNNYGDRYWKDYTGRGIKFYFLITKGEYDPRGKDSKFAVAVYPNNEFEIYNQQDTKVPLFSVPNFTGVTIPGLEDQALDYANIAPLFVTENNYYYVFKVNSSEEANAVYSAFAHDEPELQCCDGEGIFEWSDAVYLIVYKNGYVESYSGNTVRIFMLDLRNDGFYDIQEDEGLWLDYMPSIPGAETLNIEGFKLPRPDKNYTFYTVENGKSTFRGGLWYSKAKNIEEYEITPGTEQIGPMAFVSADNLKVLHVPDSITYVSDEDVFDPYNDELTIICSKGSFIDKWATEHGIKVQYSSEDTSNETSYEEEEYDNTYLSSYQLFVEGTDKKLENFNVPDQKALKEILAFINGLSQEEKDNVSLGWDELDEDGDYGDLLVSVYGPSEGEEIYAERIISNWPYAEDQIRAALGI